MSDHLATVFKIDDIKKNILRITPLVTAAVIGVS